MTTWRRTTKMIGCTGALRLDSSTARPRGIAPPRGTPTNLAKVFSTTQQKDLCEDLFTTALLASVAPTTVHADLRPTALLALRALTAVLADCTPTALLALRALTTVLADLRPTALLARTAPLPVRTSAAHLALRPGLHSVLAWPLRVRGPLPLRPLA